MAHHDARLEVRVPAPVLAQIRAAADRDGTTMSRWVRTAVERALDPKAAPAVPPAPDVRGRDMRAQIGRLAARLNRNRR